TETEIYEWFGSNLHRVSEPSLRLYVRARELKAAGMDWTEVLALEAENHRARLAAEILVSLASSQRATRTVPERGPNAQTRAAERSSRLSRPARGRPAGPWAASPIPTSLPRPALLRRGHGVARMPRPGSAARAASAPRRPRTPGLDLSPYQEDSTMFRPSLFP